MKITTVDIENGYQHTVITELGHTVSVIEDTTDERPVFYVLAVHGDNDGPSEGNIEDAISEAYGDCDTQFEFSARFVE